jgi:hypothetical protein
MEFWATGSTMAAAEFSASCPGDAQLKPKQVNHTAMVSAARPGSFNDADMLPIGNTFTMNGGKKVPVTSFTLDQAYSSLAMWAMLASPLMIGADVREMSEEFKAVWLNEELIRVSQDPLGHQGIRLRGNASECQVWLRHLDNGNELFVVLFNSGKGSCVPPPTLASPTRWKGPYSKAYSDSDCANVGNHPSKSVAECQSICDAHPAGGCDAFNYGGGGCALRSCPTDATLTSPSWADAKTVSYRHNATMPAPTQENSTMTIQWAELGVNPECMLSIEEIISGNYIGTLQQELSVSLRVGASAALRMHPHCDVGPPPWVPPLPSPPPQH